MSKAGITGISVYKRRITAVYICVALGIIAGGLLYYGSYRARLLEEAGKHVYAIEAIKLDQLKYWRLDRLAEVSTLAKSPIIGIYLARLAANSSDHAAAGLLRRQLETYIEINRYSSATLIDPGGKVLIHAGEGPAEICPGIQYILPRALASGQPEMGDFHALNGGGHVHLGIAASVAKAPGGRELLLVLRLAPEVFLYPLLQTWPGTSPTGETLLVRRDGDDVLFLNELRHQAGAAMKLRIPVSESSLPAAMAIGGRSGVVEGEDYRGVRVLAAVSPVEDTSWSMVTKIDMDEVMEGAGTMAVMLSLTGLSLLGVIAAAAFTLFRREEERHIREISEAGRRYRDLYHRMRDCFVSVSMDGLITECNEAYCRLTGYTEEELKKLTYVQLTPERWHSIEERIVREQVLPRGYSDVYEKEYLRKDGTLVPVEFITSLETDAAGKPAGMWAIVRDITARKAGESVLRQSEALLENTQSLAGIGGWEWDLDTKKMHWTPEMFRLHDIDPGGIRPAAEEYIAASQRCYRPEDLSSVMEAFNRCVENGEPYDLEYPFTTLKGRKLWVRTSAKAERAGGRIVRVLGILADITEHKKSEKAVLESKARLEAALASMTDAVLISAADGDYIEFNDAFATFHKFRNKAECGKTLSEYPAIIDIFMPDGTLAPLDIWAVPRALRGENAGNAEYTLRRKDTGETWVGSYSFSPIRGSDGAVAGSVVVARDITENKRIEHINAARARLIQYSVTHSLDELLEETLNEAERLSGSLIGFYHLVDSDQKNLTLQNWSTRTKAHFCKAKGKGEHYPVSRAGVWVDCVHQRGPVIHNDYASLPHRKGMPEGHAEVRRELVVPVFRGEKITAILGVGNKSVDYAEKDVEAISLLADLAWEIAERKRAEQAVEDLNKVLLEKNREMENFLYITTHDLRSPLVNIQGFSQNLQHYFGEIRGLLAAGGQAPDRESRAGELTGKYIPESLGFILESSAKMDAMLSALLKVSRLGRQELKVERVDACLVVNSAADTMNFQLREAGAVLKIGQLPPCRADALSVSRIFSNLLDNALKYREPGRPLIIDISGEEAGDKAVYRVSDNGRGIPAGELEKVWDIFYSYGRGAEKAGEGIGLHTVKRIAERNGGSIRAESAPGQGSVFILELRAWRG